MKINLNYKKLEEAMKIVENNKDRARTTAKVVQELKDNRVSDMRATLEDLLNIIVLEHVNKSWIKQDPILSHMHVIRDSKNKLGYTQIRAGASICLTDVGTSTDDAKELMNILSQAFEIRLGNQAYKLLLEQLRKLSALHYESKHPDDKLDVATIKFAELRKINDFIAKNLDSTFENVSIIVGGPLELEQKNNEILTNEGMQKNWYKAFMTSRITYEVNIDYLESLAYNLLNGPILVKGGN